MPTDWVIGEEVRLEHLNEDVLGRALDDLYDYGATELFRDLAAHGGAKIAQAIAEVLRNHDFEEPRAEIYT